MIKLVASRSSQQDQPLDIDELLAELAVKIDRIKVLYEQYFMGIEKIEPQVARKEVSRTMLVLQQQYIRNTGLRFKFNMMLQKWNIYLTYWNRTLREIEQGTYVRHLQKAARAQATKGSELPAEMAAKTKRPPSGPYDLRDTRTMHDHDTGSHPLIRAKPGSSDRELERVPAPPEAPLLPPPAPSAAAAQKKSPPPIPAAAIAAAQKNVAAAQKNVAPGLPKIPGMSDADLHALHQKYQLARISSGEGQVKYETLVNSLLRQVPQVLAQPGVKGVRFDVDVQGGKAVLKAIPQK
jgi:hypothetical protein